MDKDASDSPSEAGESAGRDSEPGSSAASTNLIARDEPGENDTFENPPLGFLFAGVMAALIVATYGLTKFSSILAPVFFALTLVITVTPLKNWLRRHRVPGPLASIAVLLLLYAVLVGLLSALAWALSEMVLVLPSYSAKFAGLYQDGLGLLARFGINVEDVRRMIGTIDLAPVVSFAQAALTGLSSASSQFLLMMIVLAFLIVDTGVIKGRLAVLTARRPYFAEALLDFARRVRRYWAVNTVFGAVVAGIDVLALAIIGVPLYGVWGVIAFVTNYIPNVGFILGVIPPALLALLDGGPVQALVVVIVYSAINFLIQSVVQPKFTGDAVGLNTTVTFVSLVFWSAVIGPLGAILAVPLTLFSKSVLIDSDPRLQWISVFLRAKDSENAQVKHEEPDVDTGADPVPATG